MLDNKVRYKDYIVSVDMVTTRTETQRVTATSEEKAMLIVASWAKGINERNNGVEIHIVGAILEEDYLTHVSKGVI